LFLTDNIYKIYCKKIVYTIVWNLKPKHTHTHTHTFVLCSSKVPTFVSMEPSICPITSRCSNEISSLLSPPSPHQLQVINQSISSFIFSSTHFHFHLLFIFLCRNIIKTFSLQGTAMTSLSNMITNLEKVLLFMILFISLCVYYRFQT